MSLNIKLQVFEGPLDLLLHLIEKNKLDIYDIPIAEITDQYVEYVREMAKNDMDLASEFLVIAAQLLVMKSKLLLPKEEETEEETDAELMKEELTARLIELKMFKFIAEEMRQLEDDGKKYFYGKEAIPDNILKFRPKPDLGKLLYGMDKQVLNRSFIDALRRASMRIDEVRSGFNSIEPEKIDVGERISGIKSVLGENLKKNKSVGFKSLLPVGAGILSEIVTFLVLLEMMRSGYVEARQETPADEINITVLKSPEAFGESGEFLQ